MLMRNFHLSILSALMPALLFAAGCGGARQAPANPRLTAADDQAIMTAWGTPYAQLPVQHLVLISPHNENIQDEFGWAFSRYHALTYGSRVELEWRDVGGGTSTILQYLRNVYGRADTADIDLLWGGGEQTFERLAADNILTPLSLSTDTLTAIPATFGGIVMVDPDREWCGSAVSGFGFIYNRQLLDMRGLTPPAKWQDLGDPRFYGLAALADPTQSESMAAAYELIVQSAPDWPSGWARLLTVLSNAKRFYDSAGDAANAPSLGEAAVAACIDFYGALRVAEAPESIVYVSPEGQTAFTPDPIGILKNPPHPELAQRFVDFVLSVPGQALWALPAGHADGPVRNQLGRQPIRRDVYELYGGQLLPWIVNPYKSGNEMKLDISMKQLRDPVLKRLIRAAAIDNVEDLQAARRALIEAGSPPDAMARFAELPENVATAEGIARTAADLDDPAKAEIITSGWQQFFREKYRRIAGR